MTESEFDSLEWRFIEGYGGYHYRVNEYSCSVPSLYKQERTGEKNNTTYVYRSRIMKSKSQTIREINEYEARGI